MTPKLQKLSAFTKLTASLLLLLPCIISTSKAQVFPSQIRISAGGEYALYPQPENDKNVRISPNPFIGALMEFKQLYALQLTLHANNVTMENSESQTKSYPTLGFSYDLVLKLYRSDPPSFFTPIATLGVAKQWSLMQTQDAEVESVLNDVSDWQFKAFAGADFAIAEKVHVKPLAGIAVILDNTSFYESDIFPVFRLSTDFWF
jgi:hypothetical protein